MMAITSQPSRIYNTDINLRRKDKNINTRTLVFNKGYEQDCQENTIQ